MTSPTETTPLTEAELKRLDELALEYLAAPGTFPACPECNLEPGLVVRAVTELRSWRRTCEELTSDTGKQCD